MYKLGGFWNVDSKLNLWLSSFYETKWWGPNFKGFYDARQGLFEAKFFYGEVFLFISAESTDFSGAWFVSG